MPDYYRFTDSYLGCAGCGAVVHPQFQSIHDEFHVRMDAVVEVSKFVFDNFKVEKPSVEVRRLSEKMDDDS